MGHDMTLRAAAREIYEACYPSEEWTPVPFDQAERHGSVHYRQAVDAAQRARSMFSSSNEQLPCSNWHEAQGRAASREVAG